jgi:SAM-dependent methyltransferase
MTQGKFEHRYPTVQNAVDIFEGKWATNLATLLPVVNTGKSNLLSDSRIKMAADALGRNGRFYGMRVLELGPLEAAHTYQIEQLGASHVIAVESNTEAFLKCLVVKEALKLRAEFLCGDAIEYLSKTDEKFDLIFCSGILYHMPDPAALIEVICKRSKSCFLWTHYQSVEAIQQSKRKPKAYSNGGFDTTLYELPYPDMKYDKFWGGNEPVAAWMTQDEIVRAFAYFGHSKSQLLQDHPTHPAGASFSAAFSSS